MHPILIASAAVVGVAALCISFYRFMSYPGKKRAEMQKYVGAKYAHRGLHGEGRAENSISAFAAAKEHGFGIELDVRLSKDGELVVFHDDTLTRVVGREGKVIDFTAEELSKMSLSGTSDGVPTLREVLELIDGAIPMIIEIKVSGNHEAVTKKFVEVIKGYKGDYVVESFHPGALMTLKKLRPDVMRGFLSMEYTKEDRYKGKLLYKLLQDLKFNFAIRPDFIAYDKNGYSVPALRSVRRRFGTTLITWTIKSAKEESEAINHGFDTVIFENYVPEK